MPQLHTCGQFRLLINPQNISPMCKETALYTWKVTARRVSAAWHGGSPCCAATHSGLDDPEWPREPSTHSMSNALES